MLEREDEALGFNIIGGRRDQVTPLLVQHSVCAVGDGSGAHVMSPSRDASPQIQDS